MADNLSRERMTGFLELQMLKRTGMIPIIPPLTKWFENPVEDWTLANRLLAHVIKMCDC